MNVDTLISHQKTSQSIFLYLFSFAGMLMLLVFLGSVESLLLTAVQYDKIAKMVIKLLPQYGNEQAIVVSVSLLFGIVFSLVNGFSVLITRIFEHIYTKEMKRKIAITEYISVLSTLTIYLSYLKFDESVIDNPDTVVFVTNVLIKYILPAAMIFTPDYLKYLISTVLANQIIKSDSFESAKNLLGKKVDMLYAAELNFESDDITDQINQYKI